MGNINKKEVTNEVIVNFITLGNIFDNLDVLNHIQHKNEKSKLYQNFFSFKKLCYSYSTTK